MCDVIWTFVWLWTKSISLHQFLDICILPSYHQKWQNGSCRLLNEFGTNPKWNKIYESIVLIWKKAKSNGINLPRMNVRVISWNWRVLRFFFPMHVIKRVRMKRTSNIAIFAFVFYSKSLFIVSALILISVFTPTSTI